MVILKAYADGLKEGLEHADNRTKNKAIACIRSAFELYREQPVVEFKIRVLHQIEGMAYMLLWSDTLTDTQFTKLMKHVKQLISRESEGL